jgi:hypothetical protein
MKHILLLIHFFLITLFVHSQNDTTAIARRDSHNSFLRETAAVNISIYPVPVRNNSFTIKTDRNMSAVKVTNMIGQDIFRAQYKDPLPLTKISLKQPTRGMYLVTIRFVDGTRIVKKIMVENSE